MIMILSILAPERGLFIFVVIYPADTKLQSWYNGGMVIDRAAGVPSLSGENSVSWEGGRLVNL